MEVGHPDTWQPHFGWCLQGNALIELFSNRFRNASSSLFETQHRLRFRLSGGHAAVCFHSLLKWNDLNRRRFQNSSFKTGAEAVLDFRHLFQCESITVYPKQPGEIVIEVGEVETDARISRTGDRHLPSPEAERSQ